MAQGYEIEVGLDTLKISGDPAKLYEELAKAQAEFVPVPKGDKGQIGKRDFKYAGYATIMRCVRPYLSKYGISIVQPLHSRDGMAVTSTILAGHGASVSCSFAFPMNSDPQEFGRHHTYYRRYQLQAMLGIEGDKDADELPDVNESRETSSYSEPERKEAPKAPAKASAERKPAPAEKQTDASAQPSEPTTNGKSKNGKAEAKTETKAEAKPAAKPVESLKTINDLLEGALKELKWGMDDMRGFYKEHVDPEGFVKASNMTLEQKQLLFKKLVEVKNVTPL